MLSVANTVVASSVTLAGKNGTEAHTGFGLLMGSNLLRGDGK